MQSISIDLLHLKTLILERSLVSIWPWWNPWVWFSGLSHRSPMWTSMNGTLQLAIKNSVESSGIQLWRSQDTFLWRGTTPENAKQKRMKPRPFQDFELFNNSKNPQKKSHMCCISRSLFSLLSLLSLFFGWMSFALLPINIRCSFSKSPPPRRPWVPQFRWQSR